MKTAFITGASSGIGKATALQLAKNGFNVAIGCNKNAEAAQQTADQAEKFGVKAVVVQGDLSDTSQAKNVFLTAQKLGGIDILVNNAAVCCGGLFQDLSQQAWQNMRNINLDSMLLLTQLALPHMINQQYGKIINIGSVWGVVGGAYEVHYSALKSALSGFSRALAKEVAPSNVTVNTVIAGYVDTPMTADLTKEEQADIIKRIPLGRAGKAEDVAAAVAFLCSSAADYITAAEITVDGGWSVNC